MGDVSGTQQQGAATNQEEVKPLAHGKLLKQKVRDLLIKKKRCDAANQKREPTGEEIELQNSPQGAVGNISYKELNKILLQRDTPVLVVFYSSKVPLSHHNTSNEQSKRCNDVCDIFQKLEDRVREKVKFVKFDIEKSEALFEISNVPTIKLYPRLDAERKYPVEYFDDPLIVSSYEQFLEEEGVIKL